MIGPWAREFFGWWLSQLGELIPGARRDADARTDAVLVIVPDFSEVESAATARVERRGKSQLLGRVALDDNGLRHLKGVTSPLGRMTKTLIEVPAAMILEKRLTLPLAAERELGQVLSYELDRETPFAADEVYWRSDVEQRDRAKRLITLRLAIVAKAPLADTIASLSRAALTPSALIGADNEGRRTTISLDRAEARGRGNAVPVSAWSCAVLAVAALCLPFVQQSIALDRVEREIDAVRPAVEAVGRLRQHAVDDRRQADALAAQRAELGNPLAVLAAVTAAIPDDTWLSTLEYSAGKLRLSGQSRAASHLIADLSRAAGITDPEFSAPVTRAEDGKFDIFTISARMKN